jgi:hypothetical protein
MLTGKAIDQDRPPEALAPRGHGRRVRHRIALLVVSLLIVLTAAYLLMPGRGMHRYISDPLGPTGVKISVLAPRGWQAQLEGKRKHTSVADGFIVPDHTYTIYPTTPQPSAIRLWLAKHVSRIFAPADVVPGTGVTVTAFRDPDGRIRSKLGVITDKEVMPPQPGTFSARGKQTIYMWEATRAVIEGDYLLIIDYTYSDEKVFRELHTIITESIRLDQGG